MGEAQKVDQSGLSCPEIEGNNVMKNLMKIWMWKLSNFFFFFKFWVLFSQHMVESFYTSCTNMLSKWDKIVASEGSLELDVWPYLQAMTSDVIARAAFGSGYDEGGKIFQLQMEQADRILEANRSLYIPGWRCMQCYLFYENLGRYMQEFIHHSLLVAFSYLKMVIS